MDVLLNSANQPLVHFSHVSKSFGATQALKDLSFSVNAQDRIIGLLGVNGAGKTTCIELMLGRLLPTAGEISVFGKNPTQPPSRLCIGSTPQEVDFPFKIKVKEVLHFVQSHYQNPRSVDEMVQRFMLGEFLQKKATSLSGGQKRRLALALAFIGNPQLVFLDEPTTGLDVATRALLWEIVQEEAQLGKTIILTTHYLEEIERVATRVLFLHQGGILVDGTLDDVKKKSHLPTAEVSFLYAKEEAFVWQAFDFVDSVAPLDHFAPQRVGLFTKDPDALVRALVHHGIEFSALRIETVSLEKAFLALSQVPLTTQKNEK